MNSYSRALIATVFLCVAQLSVGAQTRSTWSVQGSALYSGLAGSAFKGIDPGAGFEVQARRKIDPIWSLGCGVQDTFHSLSQFSGHETVTGLFCESRRIVDIDRESVFPYISARLGALSQNLTSGTFTSDAKGTMMNLGTGVMVPLSGGAGDYPTLLEIGASGGYTWFGDVATNQGSVTTSKIPSGGGWNYVLRVGLAVGLPFGNPPK